MLQAVWNNAADIKKLQTINNCKKDNVYKYCRQYGTIMQTIKENAADIML